MPRPRKWESGRQGIVSKVLGADQHIRHLVVRNCYIHDVWGQLGGRTEYVGRNSCAILVTAPRGGESTLDDVLVEDNRIERFDKVGIVVDGGRSGVIVRRNVMDNLGRRRDHLGWWQRGCDRVQRGQALLSQVGFPGSACRPEGSEVLVATHGRDLDSSHDRDGDAIQRGLRHGAQPRNGDGEAYDFDFGCRRCVCQYNYSKHNHGLLLIMYDATDNITRYNISENDQTHLIQLQCAISEKNLLYNNIFYVDYGTADLDFFCGDDGTKDKSELGGYLSNNIFYAAGQGRFQEHIHERLRVGKKVRRDRKAAKSPRDAVPPQSLFRPLEERPARRRREACRRPAAGGPRHRRRWAGLAGGI